MKRETVITCVEPDRRAQTVRSDNYLFFYPNYNIHFPSV